MEGADRLEIAVKGGRQAAFQKTPELAATVLREAGVVVEQQHGTFFEMPDHWIPYYLIQLSLPSTQGSRFWFESGKERQAIAYSGCCDVLPPQELRRVRYQGEFRAIMVSIAPEFLQSIVAESNPRSAFELVRNMHREDPPLRKLMLDLQSQVTSGSPNGVLLSESVCLNLAEHLLKNYSIGRVRLGENQGGISPARLRRVVEYIDSELGADLRTEDIARVAGLSNYHCGKAFRRTTGMSLHGYVLTRRINRSRQLLRQPDLALAEIADTVGFSSQSHFTTVFVTRTGLTPAAFRQMNRRLSIRSGGSQ